MKSSVYVRNVLIYVSVMFDHVPMSACRNGLMGDFGQLLGDSDKKVDVRFSMLDL